MRLASFINAIYTSLTSQKNLPKAGTDFDKRSIFVQVFDKNLQKNLKKSKIRGVKNPILAHKTAKKQNFFTFFSITRK
jgi:hypothetical protein